MKKRVEVGGRLGRTTKSGQKFHCATQRLEKLCRADYNCLLRLRDMGNCFSGAEVRALRLCGMRPQEESPCGKRATSARATSTSLEKKSFSSDFPFPFVSLTFKKKKKTLSPPPAASESLPLRSPRQRPLPPPARHLRRPSTTSSSSKWTAAPRHRLPSPTFSLSAASSAAARSASRASPKSAPLGRAPRSRPSPGAASPRLCRTARSACGARSRQCGGWPGIPTSSP